MNAADRLLRIGVIAPPWIPIPPPKYGGTELVVDVLCRGLQDLGHEVVLFTVGSSTCSVERKWLFETCDPDRIGFAIRELRHVAAAYEALADCDIIHDNTYSGLFLSQLRPGPPVVATNHSAFDADMIDLYGRAAQQVPLIAISEDHARRSGGVPIAAVIHNGLDLDRYRFDDRGGDYLVALGRMNPDKGIHIAIEVARETGLDLAIAAKMRQPWEERYFEETVKPMLGNGVEYIGEVDHAQKVELLSGALALINPIEWPEPFGLVTVESLACGTPVVSLDRGAAPELVEHRSTGYLACTTEQLIRGVGEVDRIDRAYCRQAAESRFSMERLARDHEAFYRSVLACSNRSKAGTVLSDRPKSEDRSTRCSALS